MLFAAKKPLLSAAETVECLYILCFPGENFSHFRPFCAVPDYTLNYGFCAESVVNGDFEIFRKNFLMLTNYLFGSIIYVYDSLEIWRCFWQQKYLFTQVNDKELDASLFVSFGTEDTPAEFAFLVNNSQEIKLK